MRTPPRSRKQNAVTRPTGPRGNVRSYARNGTTRPMRTSWPLRLRRAATCSHARARRPGLRTRSHCGMARGRGHALRQLGIAGLLGRTPAGDHRPVHRTARGGYACRTGRHKHSGGRAWRSSGRRQASRSGRTCSARTSTPSATWLFETPGTRQSRKKVQAAEAGPQLDLFGRRGRVRVGGEPMGPH